MRQVIRAGAFDEDTVCACFAIHLGTIKRSIAPMKRQRIGAGNHHEVRVNSGIDGGLDLGDHVFRRNQLFARQMAAALGQDLIFKMHSRHAATLVKLNGTTNVERSAKAIIGIGNQRNIRSISNPGGIIHHFRHRQQTDVRIAETRGRSTSPRHIHGLKASFRYKTRIHGVHHAWSHEGSFTCESLSQALGPGKRHRILRFSVKS